MRELACQRFELGLRKPDACQGGDMRQGGLVQRHDFTASGTRDQNGLSSVMILNNPAELREAIPADARLIGLDVGTKTIGLALSDTRRIIATPLDTIRRRPFREDVARLFALLDAHRVSGLVVTSPLTHTGTASPPPPPSRHSPR